MFRSVLAALVCGLLTTAANAGVHVTSRTGGGDPNGLSTTQPGMTTFDFNSETTLATVFKHSPSREPLGDTSIYASIGPTTLPLFNASFGVNNYFGLYWGSIDAFNTIEFSRHGTLLARFTGSDIVNPANGNLTSADTNRFVDFFFDDGVMFDEVILSSTRNSFEFDNIAIGILEVGAAPNVPEPASFLLLGIALLAIGALRATEVRELNRK
ncbi:PEP-CTERM sorting domain-containing protein [Roseiterribacter gracilis]|uniref:Ice-binding protein C-terminal domain-containing protein n=1 Tax=Roseiterribacter gracilis TaxID=2812848 RepID=A0A8S8XGP8_9PROT|nr:hypothetical protein TMPK1_25420 [Rhodospirillales bacterium TMPK1]